MENLQNLQNNSWLQDVRQIDSKAVIEPLVDASGSFRSATVAVGGFSNAIKQQRLQDDTGAFMLKVNDSPYAKTNSNYYSVNGGSQIEECIGLDIGNNYKLHARAIKYLDGMFYVLGSIEGEANSNTVLMRSLDGIAWQRLATLTEMYTDMAFMPAESGSGADTYVMVGYNRKYAYSADGSEWTEGDFDGLYTSVLYANGLFVALPQTSSIPIKYSTDGVQWSNSSYSETSGSYYTGLAYTGTEVSGDSLIMAIKYNGTGAVVSITGSSWKTVDIPDITKVVVDTTGDHISNRLVFGNGKFVFVFGGVNTSDKYNNFVLISNDASNFDYTKDNAGITWTKVVGPAVFDSVFFANGKFYAVSKRSNRLYSSVDAMSWTELDTKYDDVNYFIPNMVADNKTYNALLIYDISTNIGYFDGQSATFALDRHTMSYDVLEYASESYAGANGIIAGGVKIILSVDPMANYTRYLEIVGDQAHGEYPVEFTVDVMRSDGLKYSITNNSLITAFIDFGDIIELSSYVIINITKWSKPFTSVKLDYIGCKPICAVTQNDLLVNYSLGQSAKEDGNLGYGLKYNEATLKMFNDDISYGQYPDPNVTTDVVYRKLKNITDVLLDSQTNSSLKFYVDSNDGNGFILIGKYYTYKVEYDSQSDDVTINAYDILNRLQSIPYSGPNFSFAYNILKSATLQEILSAVKTDLYEQYGIIFDITNSQGDLITIDKVVFKNIDTIWEMLEALCWCGLFYVVAEHNDETVDIKILDRR